MKKILSFALAALLPVVALAEPPVVEQAKAIRDEMGWKFSVTIRHGDTGWEHYADAWEVLAEDGTVLATRPLRHPHVDEQPFTRSLHQVMLPDGTRRVYIRARCTQGHVSDPLTTVDIPL
ncbi:hypothetical protein [Roseovarius sp. D0-M9]|uniref:hypothetical protein n=1 Tax=Roseovarius sp. D0-M9 TaxID=3127117 RepID=UPI003010351A